MDDAQTKCTRCDNCGKIVPNYDVVSYGSIEKGYRELCGHCFNTEVARLNGLSGFEHLNLEPVRLVDCAGESHDFHFRTRLLGPEVALDAFEIRDGHPAGYAFQIIGDSEEDRLALLGRLIARIRRALSVKHLRRDDRFGLQIADHNLVRGGIEWDGSRDDDQVPLVIVDGQEISWEQLGRMMTTFEGSHFRLEIHDKSVEL